MSAPSPAAATGRGGLRKLFWVAAFGVVLLAVAALGATGYLAQQELRSRLETLQTQLEAAEQELAETQARARVVETTLDRVHQLSGQLAASLGELHALTAPPSSARGEEAPSPDRSGSTTEPSGVAPTPDEASAAGERAAAGSETEAPGTGLAPPGGVDSAPHVVSDSSSASQGPESTATAAETEANFPAVSAPSE